MAQLQMQKDSGAMARDADNFICVSVFLSHLSFSESHVSSSALSEEIQSNLVEVAVKDYGSMKIDKLCSLPLLLLLPGAILPYMTQP